MIISMATESYLEWVHHFVKGLEGNTDEKILINLINVTKEKQQILKQQFPKVMFKSHTLNIEKREIHNPDGKTFKVTYLKGKFMRQAFQKYNDRVLWIDITALIRKNLDEIFEKFNEHDVLLMRRRNDIDFGKSVYACEIFGINSNEEIERYYETCNSFDKDWFSDQLALCSLKGNQGSIKFGRWSNFSYDEEACSWSDRGRNGTGTATLDDINFTHDKFIDDLEKKIPKYREKFENFKLEIKNKKILIHVDDNEWCYVNTVREIMKIPGFDITVIYNAAQQRADVLNWEGDLVWGRCGSYRHKKLLEIRPDLRAISFSTITTGGESLFNRFFRQIQDGRGEAGVIVQNNEAKALVDHYNKKEKSGMKCFVLPNGVNINNFKQKKHHDKKKYIVGFVGRSNVETERELKGVNYVDFCCDMANLKTKIASNTQATLVKFEDMPKFYQKIDVLLLPSNSEGCSNTINEAMASGLPVITPRIGWHGDVCNNNEILFCSRNTEDIYEALEKLKDPAIRYAYGDNAREFAERHSWENMLKYYKTTFNKMIEVAAKNKKIKKKQPVVVKKIKPSVVCKFISVKGLRKVNLGKLENNGPVLWFTEGMIRQIPNDEKHKRAIDHYIKMRYLEIVN